VEIPIGIGSRPRHRRGAKLTRLLLDTTFLIDAERTGDELDEVIDDDDDAAIAAITVAELRVGVELSRGKARSSRHEFLNDVLASIPLLEYNLASQRTVLTADFTAFDDLPGVNVHLHR
jgi:hypothetical protein